MDARATKAIYIIFCEPGLITKCVRVSAAILFNNLKFDLGPLTDLVKLEGVVTPAPRLPCAAHAAFQCSETGSSHRRPINDRPPLATGRPTA